MNLETFKILEYDKNDMVYIVEIDSKRQYISEEEMEHLVALIIQFKIKNLLGKTNLYSIGEMKKIFDYILKQYEWKKLDT